jgi:SAM-dependent methyltransferase
MFWQTLLRNSVPIDPQENDLILAKGDFEMAHSLDAAKGEEARIRAAYAKREEADSRYSWFSPGHLFMVQERERCLLALLRRYGVTALESKRILEVGCGTGHWLRDFVKWGALPENLTGIDLLPDRVSKARSLCPAGVRIQCSSAAHLPFATEGFDLVVQSTVFTLILDPHLKQRVAAEMMRVVKVWWPRTRFVGVLEERSCQLIF